MAAQVLFGKDRAADLGAQHVNDEAAGAQAVQQERVGAVLAHTQQLKLAHGRQLQAGLQRRHPPAQLRYLPRPPWLAAAWQALGCLSSQLLFGEHASATPQSCGASGMCSKPEVFEWRVGPKVALQSAHKGRAPSMPKCTSARGDLWYGAKGCKVGGQLLHGLQQASRLGILATLHRLLQLVCAAWVRVTTCVVLAGLLFTNTCVGLGGGRQLNRLHQTTEGMLQGALHPAGSESARTHCINQHGQAAESGDGVGQVRFGVVKLAYVAADLLHHHLARLRLAPYLPYLAK